MCDDEIRSKIITGDAKIRLPFHRPDCADISKLVTFLHFGEREIDTASAQVTGSEATGRKENLRKKARRNAYRARKRKKELEVLRKMEDAIRCPITLVPWLNPVIASDGFLYEQRAITEWLRHSQTSPCTRETLRGLTQPIKPLCELSKCLEEVLRRA